MRNYIIFFSFFLLLSCKATTQIDDIGAPSDSNAVNFSDFPDNLSQTPILSWDESIDELSGISYYEAKILKYDDNSIVKNWVRINPGERITNVNLEENIYYVVIRSTDRSGNTSKGFASQPWLAKSDGCYGSMLTNTPYAKGNGSHEDPYLLCNSQQLLSIAKNTEDFGSYFKLLANIDFKDLAFDGIGSDSKPFNGFFLGNNKTIKNMTINRSSGDYVGFFNYIDKAYMGNLNFIDPVIIAKTSSYVGVVAGEANEFFVQNITLSNVSVEGKKLVGSFFGYLGEYAFLLKGLGSGIVKGSESYVGGIVGEISHSTVFNITSTVNVEAPLADFVGGMCGGDSWPITIQNINIQSNVEGNNNVGGICGAIYDGAYIYRSTFKGNVSGHSSVGGVLGVLADSPFYVYSTAIEADIYGVSKLGGFIGKSIYVGHINDSYVKGNINSFGTSQESIGGFVGYLHYYLEIIRSYSNMNIISLADFVGGFFGYIGYWHAGSDVNDSFAVNNVEGSSDNDNISLFIGYNSSDPYNGTTENYYSTESTCINNGLGNCNTGTGIAIANDSYFYDKTNLPLSNWDFTDIWQENANDFPTLNLQQLHTPSITCDFCNTATFVGRYYKVWPDGFININDLDKNEIHYIFFTPENTCKWLKLINFYGDLRVFGTPSSGDVGTCLLSYFISDGTNHSEVYEAYINVFNSEGVYFTNALSEASITGFGGMHASLASSYPIVRLYTLHNKYSEPITSLSITIQGLAAGEVSYSGGSYPGTNGTCGDSLAPGGSCDFELYFNPSEVGSKQDILHLNFVGENGELSFYYEISFSAY